MRTNTSCRELLLSAALLLSGPGPAAAATRIVVVTTSGVEAYGQALEGLQAALGKASQVQVVDLAAREWRDRLPPLAEESHCLILTVGPDATEALASLMPACPVISTMILRSDAAAEGDAKLELRNRSRVTTVTLDIPLGALLKELKQIFPGKTRLGILRNPQKGGAVLASLQAQAAQYGFTVKVAECTKPAELLAAFLSLKNQVDFVWCLPDSTLYNSTTVRPLVLASLGHRLPIIGFSESFVQAGALVGVYADFRDIGRQTGEAVQRWLEGHSLPAQEGPRRLRVSCNSQVARLLGLPCPYLKVR